MYKCKECGNKEIRLITNKNGIGKYFCPKCNCYFFPDWLMKENVKNWKARKNT